MTWHTKRLLKHLVTCTFPEDQANVAKRQIEDIVAYHAAKFSAWGRIHEQMEAVSLDCYIQGLIDGNQIPRVIADDDRSQT